MADDLLTGGGEAPLQPGTPRPANTITDERLMEIVNAVYTPTVWSDTLVQGTPDIPGKMNALEQYIATLTEVNRDMALAVIALRDSVSQTIYQTTEPTITVYRIGCVGIINCLNYNVPATGWRKVVTLPDDLASATSIVSSIVQNNATVGYLQVEGRSIAISCSSTNIVAGSLVYPIMN